MALETGLLVGALVASAAGTAVSIVGQQEAADAQKRSADYNAQVAQNNAIAAQQESEYEAARIRDKNRRVLASATAAQAKNGVVLDGSSSDVLYDSSVQGELDAMAALYTGKVSANASTAEARLQKMKADSADPTLGMLATGLGGVGSEAALYGSFMKSAGPKTSAVKSGGG